MRQGSNGRRPRGRPQRKQHGGGGTPRQGNFDSSGPEGRIRGNAHQVYEKYIGLARDATSAGDRIAAETYYQYAEHYYRIVNARTDPKPEGEGQPGTQPGAQPGAQPGRRGGNGQAEVVGDAAQQDAGVQVSSPALNGEQPQVAPQVAPQATPQATPQAEDRPAPQRRRRPRQTKPAEPQPVSKPDPEPEVQASPEVQPNPKDQAGKDSEPAET